MEVITYLRERLSMNRETVAALLGVSCKTVQRWENGETSPSRLAAREIARLSAELSKASEKSGQGGK